jgi:hypothetical protein
MQIANGDVISFLDSDPIETEFQVSVARSFLLSSPSSSCLLLPSVSFSNQLIGMIVACVFCAYPDHLRKNCTWISSSIHGLVSSPSFSLLLPPSPSFSLLLPPSSSFPSTCFSFNHVSSSVNGSPQGQDVHTGLKS